MHSKTTQSSTETTEINKITILTPERLDHLFKRIAKVEEKVEKLAITVRRLAARNDKSRTRGRPHFAVALQETAFGYWERGRRLSAVREFSAGRHKTSHAQVYGYFNRELSALGISDAAEFSHILRLRTLRIGRNKAHRK